jgi:uncharacterized protein
MKQIFLNLPVNDLLVSSVFYTALGFKNEPLFSGENQNCMVWSDQIYVMLQTKAFFGSGNNKITIDPNTHASASFTLPVESLDKVNQMVESGLKSGGKEPISMQDLGFMQIRTLEDPDGHTWGIIHLDIEEFKVFKEI